ncbi:MAG: putative RNA methyltransferase [Syntrophus sp. PtaB.Bin001]|nr:MAG: putative RNA methyltransferase [Syntrophus sp. PtaB.Bin001]
MQQDVNQDNARKFLNIGTRQELDIDRIAFGGLGIGRIQDLVVFVPFAADGDRLEIEIVDVRRTYATGRICRILQPSVFRTDPKCLQYRHCGGCQYQHINYAHQLEIKKKQVMETFERIGKLPDPPVKEVIPSPEPYGYRGKAEFHVKHKQGSTPIIGYKEAAESRIVPVTRCEIVDETINSALESFRKKLEHASPSAQRMDNRERKVTFWSDVEKETDVQGRAAIRKRQVIRQVNGKILLVPVQGFFQANHHLVYSMVNHVVSICELSGNESVLDAYCGSGLFSMFLAPHAKILYGIDFDEAAILCADDNLRNEGLTNASFSAGDVAHVLKKLFVKKNKKIDLVILDPPRVGCGSDVLDCLQRLSPEKIVYISCNPTTQARDVLQLRSVGYNLRQLQPFDMFPQTKHIEVVGVLERA